MMKKFRSKSWCEKRANPVERFKKDSICNHKKKGERSLLPKNAMKCGCGTGGREDGISRTFALKKDAKRDRVQ